VTYNTKHNEANGENNQDGTDAHLSDNCGVEGPSTDAAIETLRLRQIKNFLLTLLISRGVPMLLSGDEMRRTQGGNNNAYCQDNETSWLDWKQLEEHQDIYRFAGAMIAFRHAHPVLRTEQFYTSTDIRWLNESGGSPDWSDPRGKHLACLIQEDEGNALLLMFNAQRHDIEFCLPALPHGARWNLAVDTSRASPTDGPAASAPTGTDHPRAYCLKARSSAIFSAARGSPAAGP
jgi:glycogen operon protein